MLPGNWVSSEEGANPMTLTCIRQMQPRIHKIQNSASAVNCLGQRSFSFIFCSQLFRFIRRNWMSSIFG